MKYAFCLEMLYTELPFNERLALARKDGIQSIEIWDYKDKDLQNLQTQLTHYNMTVSNMSGNRRFGMIDSSERSEFLEEVRQAADVAKRIDCSMLMLLSQPLLENDHAKPLSMAYSDEEKIAQIVTRGKEAGEVAEQWDIDIVIEPLNSVLDHPGFFLNSSKLGFEIIRKIAHPRIKLLYDIYHMAMMGEDVLGDLRNNLHLIGHIHMADKPGRHEPGSGKIDFSAVISQLESLNYNGMIGFEFTPSEADSQSAIKKTLQIFHS